MPLNGNTKRLLKIFFFTLFIYLYTHIPLRKNMLVALSFLIIFHLHIFKRYFIAWFLMGWPTVRLKRIIKFLTIADINLLFAIILFKRNRSTRLLSSHNRAVRIKNGAGDTYKVFHGDRSRI